MEVRSTASSRGFGDGCRDISIIQGGARGRRRRNQKNSKPKSATLPKTPHAIPPIAPGVNPFGGGVTVVETDATDDMIAILGDVVYLIFENDLCLHVLYWQFVNHWTVAISWRDWAEEQMKANKAIREPETNIESRHA
jgi:hypothetical protein